MGLEDGEDAVGTLLRGADCGGDFGTVVSVIVDDGDVLISAAEHLKTPGNSGKVGHSLTASATGTPSCTEATTAAKALSRLFAGLRNVEEMLAAIGGENSPWAATDRRARAPPANRRIRHLGHRSRLWMILGQGHGLGIAGIDHQLLRLLGKAPELLTQDLDFIVVAGDIVDQADSLGGNR